MNGIEGICGKIISEAEKKAEEIILQAKKEAELSKSEKDKAKEQLVLGAAAEGEAKARAVEEKCVKNASMEAKKMTAAKKQELIDKAFQNALAGMLALPDNEYEALLAKLAVSACSGGSGGELVFNAGDLNKHGGAVLKLASSKLPNQTLVLSSDTADIKGGVIVKQGSIELNCSLEVIIRMLKEELSLDVAHALFDKGE